MSDALFDQPAEMGGIGGNPLSNQTRPRRNTVADHIKNGIHRRIVLQREKRTFARTDPRRGGALLSLGEGVHEVVDHDTGDIDISPDGMGQVAGTDAKKVTVPSDGKDGHLRFCQLGSLRNRDGLAVDAVEAIGVHIGRYPGGTPDPGDHEGFVRGDTDIGQHPLDQRIEKPVRSTARTPDRLHVRSKILALVHPDHSCTGGLSSFLLKGRPPGRQ